MSFVKNRALVKARGNHATLLTALSFAKLILFFSSLPNGTSSTGSNGKSGTKAKFTLSAATMKQLQILRQPTDWVGPVFCNTVRPLLLVQGKWSYQVGTRIVQNLLLSLTFSNILSRLKSRGDFCFDT